jgi:cation diffusion facilitator family transporter
VTELEHRHRHSTLIGKIRGMLRHRHAVEGNPPQVDPGAEGIRATKVSLIGLALTALAQAVIVVFTGSVALLSDTLHNLTDALTAIPLWIAFSLSRRRPTSRFTHGYHRTEDLAGVVIVLAIAVSAGAVVWESIGRLMNPQTIRLARWVIAAGVIGALGNEVVARYRIRVGRRIGSEALVADGLHARTDAYTSLSVVVAGIGSIIGWEWVDPAAGLIVAVVILLILRRTAVTMVGRLLDAVDPALVERAIAIAGSVEDVREVTAMRLRFSGHRLLATVSIGVDPDVSVTDGHDVGQRVAHELAHRLPYALEAVVHVDPAGLEGCHDLTEHHRARLEGRDPAVHD